MEMRSFLLSLLAESYGDSDLAAFGEAHPYCWLVWEPGAWHQPKAGTMSFHASPSKTEGEAMAFALRPAHSDVPTVTLGRTPGNDIEVNDGTISRTQLIFTRGEGKVWTVVDAGSRNGSSLNGIRLEPGKPAPLQEGSLLTAGDVRLTYHTPEGMLMRLRLLVRASALAAKRIR